MFNKKFVGFIALAALAITMTGCLRKPFDVPQFENIENNETAFVIPLTGDTSDQAKFASADQLEQKKVAAKRIQITHMWNQTGRWESEGDWVPAVKLIKVKRSPVKSEWVSETKNDPKGNGLWLESGDSIAFSVGITCVGEVLEQDTSLFLYKNHGEDLSKVMDTIARSRVQAVSSTIASKYSLDELRSRKNEIKTALESDVIPFMKTNYGVTISTIGIINGMTYENADIQTSIDKVFIAQQEKNIAKAALEAVSDKNKALIQLGEGTAQQAREIAKGQKDAAITKAEGERQGAILASEGEAKRIMSIAQAEADKIKAITAALNEAQSNPLYYKIKQLETQNRMYERWNGSVPQFQMGAGGTSPNMLLNMAIPAMAQEATK